MVTHNFAGQIASVFGLGKIGRAPGTLASAYAAGLAYVIQAYFGSTALIVFTIICAVLSIWSVETWHKANRHQAVDQSWIVIDEVVGQCLVFWYLFDFAWYWILAGFLLFRFFDILKPWPIGWADRRFKNSFGVLFDDVLAGLIAGVIMLGAQIYVG
jgi:phosphatidylglycerophosphatase A